MACELKFVEVRDRHTTVPMLAIRLGAGAPAERFLLRRSGFASEQIDDPNHPLPYVVLCNLVGFEAQYDPYAWSTPARTFRVAHLWIVEHWREFASGDVVDVEFILCETPAPKQSEAVTHGL